MLLQKSANPAGSDSATLGPWALIGERLAQARSPSVGGWLGRTSIKSPSALVPSLFVGLVPRVEVIRKNAFVIHSLGM